MRTITMRVIPICIAIGFTQVGVAGTVGEGSVTEGERGAKQRSESSGRPSIEEIIVTAQKREERLQDVPISISVISGESLNEPTVPSVAEALNRVPGVISALKQRSGGNGTAIVIRGVTPLTGASTSAYYLDSIPWGNPISGVLVPDSNSYDLDRIEVLRGPQGTLYGSSALSGVARILTKDADLDAFDIKGRASVSSTERGGTGYRGDMALNVPIIEGKVAARAVIGYEDLAGWIDKPGQADANDGQIRNYRLKVNAAPTERLSLGVMAWFNRSDYGAPSTSADGRETPTQMDEPAFNDYDAFSAKLSYQFTGFSVTSATSYVDYEEEVIFALPNPDLPGFHFASATAIKNFAEEILLNSSLDGPWRWSLGGIYQDIEGSGTTSLPPILPDPFVSVLETESFAVFGEVGRSFADGRFDVAAGLRYFEDRRVSEGFFNGVSLERLGPDKFDATTPRVVISWHPRERTTIYASYGEGFRSGRGQLSPIRLARPDIPNMQPDTMKSYELGMKGNFWSDRGAFETAVFYQDWQDVQQQLSVRVLDDFSETAFFNVGSASGLGFEVGTTLSLTEQLAVSGSFSWNDLTFDKDVISFVGSPPVALFNKGDRLIASPEISASLAADYRFPLGGGGFEGKMSMSANYISEQSFRELVETDLLIADGDDLLTARASFELASATGWSATLFCDNIGNENGLVFGDVFLPQWRLRQRPRTVGLQFEYHLK